MTERKKFFSKGSEMCKKCNSETEDTWLYCPHCQSQLDAIDCPFCSNIVRRSWAYCPHCQKKISELISISNAYSLGNQWLKEVLK